MLYYGASRDPWVRLGGAGNLSGQVGTDQEGCRISWVGSDHPDLTRPARKLPRPLKSPVIFDSFPRSSPTTDFEFFFFFFFSWIFVDLTDVAY